MNISRKEFSTGTSVFLAVIIALTVNVAFAQNPITSFWIYDGKTMQRVENGNPNEIRVVEWQVRLYKMGAPTSGDSNWGLITAKTADAVMRKLKDSQDFELRYNRWAGNGNVPDKVLTHFNPLGPIARIERAPSPSETKKDSQRLVPKAMWDKYKGIADRVNGLREGYSKIKDIVTNAPKDANPFERVGNTFREYTDNLTDAFEKLAQLREKIEGATAPSLDEINRIFGEITNDLMNIDRLAPGIARGFGISPGELVPPATAPSEPATPKVPANTDAFDQRMEALAKELADAAENIDPNDPEAYLRKIKDITRRMARLLESSPADADSRELARILSTLLDTDDPETMTSNLERLMELLEKFMR
jgi:hypothetical protein